MKKSDLHREWARVLDMCEGTLVNPVKCWKLGGLLPMYYPDFGADPMRYEFAVAILENKPVFVGDKVYDQYDGSESIVAYRPESLDGFGWHPPKKTFMLNGVELPCPVKDGEWYFTIGNQLIVRFESADDLVKAQKAIIKLFMDNTK